MPAPPPLGTLLHRALSLKCPRCGEGEMFSGRFAMHETCAACRLKFERDPGYFLGSIYINYALTAGLLTGTYVLLHFVVGFSIKELKWPMMTGLLFPIWFFRYARALWLAMDCHWDTSICDPEDHEAEPPAP